MKYTVYRTHTETYSCEVEADSEAEAIEKATDFEYMDSGKYHFTVEADSEPKGNVMTAAIAKEIAKDAAALKHFNWSPDYSGYWYVYDDGERDVAIAINKEKDEETGRKYYSIYISPSDNGDCDYEFTNGLTQKELAKKIMEVAAEIEKQMKEVPYEV